MQPKFIKSIALSITFAFAAMTITPSAHGAQPPVINPEQSIGVNTTNAFSYTDTLKKTFGAFIFFTALTCYIHLVTKKTQPKRVYPKDDSFSEVAWYTFDELLVGQMKKDERPSKVTIDPENPQELTIGYSKIEARGLTGIVYSAMKPVIVPSLTFAILASANLKELLKGIKGMIEFLDNPEKSITTTINDVWPKPEQQSANK
jgi:hypothetical protein